MQLSQDGKTVTGSGTFTGPSITNGSVDVHVSGSCTYPSFALDLSSPGFISATMNGTLVDGDSATATLDWSGFIRETLALTRSYVVSK
jgi:hypothetical protein